jgi:hypothetical protein
VKLLILLILSSTAITSFLFSQQAGNITWGSSMSIGGAIFQEPIAGGRLVTHDGIIISPDEGVNENGMILGQFDGHLDGLDGHNVAIELYSNNGGTAKIYSTNWMPLALTSAPATPAANNFTIGPNDNASTIIIFDNSMGLAIVNNMGFQGSTGLTFGTLMGPGNDPTETTDSDGDGLGDNAETNTGIWVDLNNTGTDPFTSDTDNDLLLDGFESAIGRNPNVGENFSSLTPSFELIIDPFAANIDTFNKVSNSDIWDSSQGCSILSFEGSIINEDQDDARGVINIFDGTAGTWEFNRGDIIISPHSPIEFSIPHKKVVKGFYIYTDNDRSTDGVKISYSVDGGNSYVISCDLNFNTRLTSRTDGDYSHLHGLHAVFKIDIPDIYADHFKIEFSPSNSRLIGEYPRIYEVDAIEGNAADDIDGDGLNFIEEDALGTDWHDSDTDGDGLSDGDEVNVYACNPLSADTDGDGYRDDLEVFLSNFNVNSDSSDLDLSDYGLITLQNIQDLRAGSTMIEVSENQATVQLQMEESSDLQSWEATGTPATMTIPADAETKFFRFKMAE